MSRLDEPTDPAFVYQVAHMTVDAHRTGRRCQCCTDDGCEQLDWARQSITDHRAKRVQTTPTVDRPHPSAGVARRTA